MNRRDALKAIGTLAASVLVPKTAVPDDRDEKIVVLQTLLDTEEERADVWEQGYMELLADYRELEKWYHEVCHELEIAKRKAELHRPFDNRISHEDVARRILNLTDCRFEVEVQEHACSDLEDAGAKGEQ